MEQHAQLSKDAAKEGMVLLKNRGHLLPLQPGQRLALFGKGIFDYVKGGGGSGDVHVPYVQNLYDGFCQYPQLVSVDEGLAAYYRDYVKTRYAEGGIPGMIPEAEVPQHLLDEAAVSCDTAVIAISRFSGEGWDRKSEFGNPLQYANKRREILKMQDSVFERSDFYLTRSEEQLIHAVTKAFPRVVVVMNVGGMVASDWFARDDRISSVLMAWQGGMLGGAAAAELILGIGNPSGKLADTFARDLTDYPSTDGFHASARYVDYTEDIFVGYRYFETFPHAFPKVIYPFGYGLSYTTFSVSGMEVHCGHADKKDEEDSAGSPCSDRIPDTASDVIRVQLLVTNTGAYAGKEVVQLYVSAPQGLLGKPARELKAYRKTSLLQPGESQQILLSVRAEDLASYDDLGKIQKSAWILEKGLYRFYLGTDVRSAQQLDFTYEVTEDITVRRLTGRMCPTQLPHRLKADGTYEELPVGEANDPDSCGLPRLPYETMSGRAPEARTPDSSAGGSNDRLPDFAEVAQGKLSLDEFVAALSDEALASLLGGQPNVGVANTFGCGNLPEYGVPSIMTADGPAGLRLLPETGMTATSFPCATLLACSWNPEITYAVGRAGAEEVKEHHIGVWLTAAVNIHRSPLCGRNFEYYSEDPFLAGKQAAGMVRGIQSCHVAAAVKHLALNNKETNRKDSDSRASERAIREIYLKQFEIIIREAHPWCVMSSYNIINGHRASENKDLLIGILREEWHYDGMVTSDWWTLGEHYKECAAGNDLKMACGFPDRLLLALKKGLLTRAQMETAARHILTLILRVR